MSPTPAIEARDARGEAQALVGDGLAARVLEPSPPAVVDDWFADDPVAAPVPAGRPVVSPVPGTDLTWDEWLREHPQHAGWAAARWLGARPDFPPPPPSLSATRLALHRVAAYVMAPARRRVNGKIGLRWTLGGFGTPFFGDDEQVRLVGATIVRQRGGTAVSEPVTTLARAARLVLGGPPDIEWAAGFDVPPPGDPEADLGVDPAAAASLGDWFGFGVSVLEELRAEPASTNPVRVQLWPEHFDAAFDCLPPGAAARATFGASPGDAAIDEPYLYALHGVADPPGPPGLWNADAFPGAVLTLRELLGAGDQRAAALRFYRERRDVLGR